MTDTTDDTETRMTRRDALKGGSAAAVAAGSLLLQKQLVGVATAQTTEPRINLGDNYAIDDNPDGNGDLVITDLSTDAEVLRYDRSESQWILSDFTSSRAAVTNETKVHVYPDGGGQNISAGAYTTVEFGNKPVDDRGEFTLSSNELTVDESGHYYITMVCGFAAPSDGDDLVTRLRDTNAGSNALVGRMSAGGANPHRVFVSKMAQLDPSGVYVVQARNSDSDDAINGGQSGSWLTARRAF